MFYQPDLTFSSQPPPLLGALTASIAPRRSIISLSMSQEASKFNQWNEISKGGKCCDMSDSSQQVYFSDQRYRNNAIQKQGTCRDGCHNRCMLTSQRKLDSNAKFPERDVNGGSPHIAEHQSSIQQKNISASGNPNSDDDKGFIDIDELLATMKEESISTSVEANSSGIAETDDNRTRGGSPVDSNHSTVRSTQGGHICFSHLAKDFYLLI